MLKHATVWPSWNKEFHQWCFETRTANSSEPICWSLLSCTDNMITYICCVPTLSFTVFDGVSHLSETKWITFRSFCKIFHKRHFAMPPKLAGRSFWRRRKNATSIIWTPASSGVVIVPFVSRYVRSADLGVLNIVPSTWLKLREQELRDTLALELYQPSFVTIYIKCSQTNRAFSMVIKLFCRMQLFSVYPVSVANEMIFCLL